MSEVLIRYANGFEVLYGASNVPRDSELLEIVDVHLDQKYRGLHQVVSVKWPVTERGINAPIINVVKGFK